MLSICRLNKNDVLLINSRKTPTAQLFVDLFSHIFVRASAMAVKA